jgi:hypothetical protein
MNNQQHFIVFRRTDNHCATWLIRANSLRDALIRFALEECAEAELQDDGHIAVSNGYGDKIQYDHPLACIENEEKIYNGGESWNGWEIKLLQEKHWIVEFTEVFCSENPFDVENYIELCRPLHRQRYPRSRARGFVWYLKEGPLVTFYRLIKRRHCWPAEVLDRYLISWQEYPKAYLWNGTYEDILEQMKVENS